MSSASPQRRSFGKAPLFDEAAVARAEQALQSLSGHFQGWLEEEVEKVQAARLEARAERWSNGALETLLLAAHDMKGLGATYDYPLATRIAGSLCRLLETPEGKIAARKQPQLVEAHVDAIRAAARDRIKSSEHPIGNALLKALEERVDELGLAPAA